MDGREDDELRVTRRSQGVRGGKGDWSGRGGDRVGRGHGRHALFLGTEEVAQKGTAWQLAVPGGFCQVGKGWQEVASWQMRKIVRFSYWPPPIYVFCTL